ncbi:MAG: hypothetical protein MJZ75_01505 [Paludibacteraceae bacterium]|nr:hypothetical protein [Paludibacteraceae bacterium]
MKTQFIQLLIACIACTAGIVVIVLCIYIDPQGEIHSSVLVAYGETLTFAGSIIGVDYHYRYKDK